MRLARHNRRKKDALKAKKAKLIDYWPEALDVPQDERWNYCNKLKDCGHECDGVRDEPVCLPCLNPDCGAKTTAELLMRAVACTIEDSCGICF